MALFVFLAAAAIAGFVAALRYLHRLADAENRGARFFRDQVHADGNALDQFATGILKLSESFHPADVQ